MKRYILYSVVALVFVALLAGCSTRAKRPRHGKGIERAMVTTGYCKCGICTGWTRTFWGKPVYLRGPNKGKRKKVGITAVGTKAKPGTIAADTSIYPFGTVMHIPGYGYGRVEDRGGAIKGEHIDLFFKSHKKALKWGKRNSQVTVWRKQT